MRIAIFTDSYMPQINGVSKTLSKFSEYLDKRGIEYLILAPSFGKSDDETNVIRSRSVSVFLYPQLRLSTPNYRKLYKSIDNFKPDLIHLMTEFNMGLCGHRYAKKRNVKVVSSFETDIPQYFKYYKAGFLEKPSWKYLKWFHGKCLINFCPSVFSVERLRDMDFKNPMLWERGIETDKFSPDFRDENLLKEINHDGKINFIYVGRVSPEKDLHIFLSVAKKIYEEYGDKVGFTIVGDGPSLKSLKENATPNVVFTGFVIGDELSRYYASADVFLFPSPTETLGFVILEAMSSGLCVIACNEGGVSDNLVDRQNGIACRKHVEEDYLNAAKEVIEDKLLRETLQKNAREYALTKDWDKCFDRLIESYKTVL